MKIGVQHKVAELSFSFAVVGALAVGAVSWVSGYGWEAVLIRGSLTLAALGAGSWLLTRAADPAWHRPARASSSDEQEETTAEQQDERGKPSEVEGRRAKTGRAADSRRRAA